VPRLAGRAIPGGGDPRTCPACALARWLDILGVADGLGRGSARMALTVADAPTSASPHQHTPSEPPRWRGAAVLLPAIDRLSTITQFPRAAIKLFPRARPVVMFYLVASFAGRGSRPGRLFGR